MFFYHRGTESMEEHGVQVIEISQWSIREG